MKLVCVVKLQPVVLWYTSVYYNILQYTTIYFSILQYTPVYYNILYHSSIVWSLHHSPWPGPTRFKFFTWSAISLIHLTDLFRQHLSKKSASYERETRWTMFSCKHSHVSDHSDFPIVNFLPKSLSYQQQDPAHDFTVNLSLSMCSHSGRLGWGNVTACELWHLGLR